MGAALFGAIDRAQTTYRQFGDALGVNLNLARIQSDRDRLDAALEQVKLDVDKTIAHADRFAGNAPTITYNELDAAIDEVHGIVKPYIALLAGQSFSDITPTQ